MSLQLPQKEGSSIVKRMSKMTKRDVLKGWSKINVKSIVKKDGNFVGGNAKFTIVGQSNWACGKKSTTNKAFEFNSSCFDIPSFWY